MILREFDIVRCNSARLKIFWGRCMRHWKFPATSGNITIEETVTYQFGWDIEEGKEAMLPSRDLIIFKSKIGH